MRPEVLGGIGGFSGAFSLSGFKHMKNPTLLSGTDGVGTKLKLAFILDKHDTVGIDCVAMCVNDIACAGASPLFFLDYIACGKNTPTKIADIVKGVSAGCIQSGAALIGGETAEMPGFYAPDEYDLAGFTVGIAEQDELVDGHDIVSGDVVIGIASSGLHSNGFSLVRNVFMMNISALSEYCESISGRLGEVLLTPTKIYVKALRSVKDAGLAVKGCCNITGGGFYENIPRMLPEGLSVRVKKGSWTVPPIFGMIAEDGNVDEHVMFNTFNMGVGMVLAVAPSQVDAVISALGDSGEQAFVIGETVPGDKSVGIL
jgi:phosphoribosylformylglycinamidine cyclo-ligase